MNTTTPPLCRRLRPSLSIVSLILFTTTTIPFASSAPSTPSLNRLSLLFSRTMGAIHDALDQLGKPELDTARHLEAAVTGDAAVRQARFRRIISILNERVDIEKKLLADLTLAHDIYGQLGLESEAERDRLREMNQAMERELSRIGDELSDQVDRLADVLETKEELPLFRHYTSSRKTFFETMTKQLASAELPDLDRYFERWLAVVRTRLLADQHQLLNFAYYANAFNWIDGRQRALEAVAETGTHTYLNDIGKVSINGLNFGTVLDTAFGDMATTAYDLNALMPAEGTSTSDGFTVSLVPSRGAGGTYFYSDSPDGLQDPTTVLQDDGTVFYAERVAFTITASRSCYFLLRHVDARGNVQQICPNRHSPNMNRLQADVPFIVPAPDMPFEFAAAPPSGVESVRLVVTLDNALLTGSYTKEQLPLTELVAEEIGMATDGGQPLTLQQPQDAREMATHAHAYYRDHAGGNAVSVQAFIQILPLSQKNVHDE